MKNLFLLFLSILTLVSCKKKGNGPESSMIDFYPRECNYMWASWSKIKDASYNGVYLYDILNVNENELRAKDALITISTSNLDTLLLKIEKAASISCPYCQQEQIANLDPKFDQKLAPHNVALEAQLQNDYNNPVSKLKSAKAEETNLIRLEYRVTGVKNLTITSTHTLFGKTPGTVITEYFTIKQLEPKQVISSKTSQLLIGYSDKDTLATIAEWLYMEPMAQPTIFLAFKTVPAELPAAINFIVTLETNNGKIIRDTTSTLAILP